MMGIKFDNIDIARNRIYRRLLVLCLILFALYPLFDAALDAYTDHMLHPVRMSPDDRLRSERRNDHSPKIIALFHRVSFPAIEEPVFYFFKTGTMPAVAIKTSQTCPPLSSDPSPPVV
jgi:hypothetical protein